MEAPLSDRSRMLQLGILGAACIGLFIYFFIHAWVAEDAYISFRVIDNFAHGYGLRWNIHERVQAYTHPLWLLLHIGVYELWPNLFHVTIALSLLCSLGALILTIRTVRHHPLVALCCFLLPLALSKSFVDYTTSGLENPLSYVLFASFGFVLLRMYEHRFFWLFLSLALSMALLNRMDAVILFLPITAYLLLESQRRIDWVQITIGLLPLIAWLSFSFLYYGFLFPNTKYAKLGTGVEISLYLQHGLRYLQQLIVKDPPGTLLLLSSAAFALPGAIRPEHPFPRWPLAVAAGIWLWCLYVIFIGGDYMMGRFWSVPIFAAAWLWYATLPKRLRPDILFVVLCLCATSYAMTFFLNRINESCDDCLPARERMIDAEHNFGSNHLVEQLWPLKLRGEGNYRLMQEGINLTIEPGAEPKVLSFIGMSGFYAGPGVNIIDHLALADPMLARLPASNDRFYIGHFKREIPKGYLWARATGDLSGMDPSLGKYFNVLRYIISGDIWDFNRIKTSIMFNLGAYDHWKKEYLLRGA